MADERFNGTRYDPPESGMPRQPEGRPLRGSRSGGREPVFNLPPFIIVFVLLLVAIHAARVLLASPDFDLRTVLALAFIPARYSDLADQLPMPMAAIWSPVTYSLLHGSWTHLLVNLFWLLAFGSPVARRLGTFRVTVLALLSSLAGAAAHYAAFPGEMVPMIGASAVVAGCMGAAARFAFAGRQGAMLNVDGPAQTLVQSFSNPGFLAFLIVWLAINYIAGSGVLPIPGQTAAIAWQAHVGGFVAGLLAFSALDPRRV